MGWKGYESEISVGMLFKKMYCFKCGGKLKKQKVSNISKKGEDGYSGRILGHATIGMDKVEKVGYIYKCSKCGLEISYDEQLRISKIQKRLKKKILADEEMN